MIFGSKTGYGRADVILQPSHLQVCNEIDVQAPSKKLVNIASVLGLATRHRVEPSPYSIRRVETQSFREVPTGSMACLPH